jgi:hypothetical protein
MAVGCATTAIFSNQEKAEKAGFVINRGGQLSSHNISVRREMSIRSENKGTKARRHEGTEGRALRGEGVEGRREEGGRGLGSCAFRAIPPVRAPAAPDWGFCSTNRLGGG